MKLTHRFPPHIRAGENNFSVMCDVIIALLPLYFLAFYFYGARSIVSMLISIGTCFVSDLACQFIARRKVGIADLSAVVTGMLIPMMLPASIDYGIIIVAGLFAILVVKQPFGGLGQNIFNPAAAGVAFAAITWSDKVFAYPIPLGQLEIWGDAAIRLVGSPASRLQIGATPSNALMDMLLGNFPGPMGATNILVLITCLIFLVVRKTSSGRMTLSFVLSCAVFAFLFPRIGGTRVQSVCYELMSGALLFGAIFLLNDPATSPKRESSKTIYAAVAGIVTMLFRYFGGFEEGIFFSIVLMNAFVWLMDMQVEKIHSKARRRPAE